MPETGLLLEMSSVKKSYGGVRALKGVSFDLRAGEVHALVGENGAGKSTLIKVISGAVQADAGTVMIGGDRLEHNDPSLARSRGVVVIYQQPALFPDLSVAENIALALDRPGSMWRRIDWRSRREQAKRLLETLGARIDPNAAAASLSMPEQQLVEIAKAIGAEARIFIFDEPTASLGVNETERLFAIIDDLRLRGRGIIYISHRLKEVMRLADRITVLREGETVRTSPAQAVTEEELVRLMAGAGSAAPRHEPPRAGDVVLRARGLSCSRAGVHRVDLDLRAGEITGLAGLIGAGRTELARVLFGITPATSGVIEIAGRTVFIGSARDAIRSGIAYVPEDRRRHGVILPMTIAQNVSMSILGKLSRNGLIDRERERKIADEFGARLQIRMAGVDAPVDTLSGGNQQKVALARWLATQPRVLIVDEPTQGVDVGAKGEIHALIRELSRRGIAVLLISSEIEELLEVADRILVMRGGTIVEEFERAGLTPELVLAAALGAHIRGGAGI